jgi:hypothetical protein
MCMERQDSRNRVAENHGVLEREHERRSQERRPKKKNSRDDSRPGWPCLHSSGEIG